MTQLRLLGVTATARLTRSECWIGAAWGRRHEGDRVVLLGVPFCVVQVDIPGDRVSLSQWLREIQWHAE